MGSKARVVSCPTFLCRPTLSCACYSHRLHAEDRARFATPSMCVHSQTAHECDGALHLALVTQVARARQHRVKRSLDRRLVPSQHHVGML